LLRPENPLIVKEVPVRSSTRFNRAPALVGAVALLAASLAGCSAIPGFGACQPVYESGDASSIVTASGTTPKMDFPTPLVAGTTPEVSTIDAGEGDPIRQGAQVDFDFVVENGESGEDSGSNTGRVAAGVEGNSLSEALQCARVGDRLALVTQASDVGNGFGPGALEGIDLEQTFVIVIDVTGAYLGKADGFNQLPLDGMPTVATEVGGQPGITVPAEEPPAELRFSAIKAGDGRKLEVDDQAVLHFSLWTWPAEPGGDISPVGSTWDADRAQTLTVSSYDDGGGMPDGLVNALVGQRVGSQILVVIPPGDQGFPADQMPSGITEDSTAIFVVDILGIQK
jgi:peptidylprolyl isomerase